jgi:hypothetical protein
VNSNGDIGPHHCQREFICLTLPDASFEQEEDRMPRYMVERSFPDGLHIPVDADGAQALGGIVATNADEGVTWVHSYVSADKTRTFCVYDAPSPDAIRSVGAKNNVPVDAIHEVSVLDPYFYH